MLAIQLKYEITNSEIRCIYFRRVLIILMICILVNLLVKVILLFQILTIHEWLMLLLFINLYITIMRVIMTV